MGTTHSRPHQQPSSPASPVSRPSGGQASTAPTRREPRRRESINALPSVKATAAPPSESHASATAHSAQHQSHREQISGSRQPSLTLSGDELSAASPLTEEMGNQGSRSRHDHAETKAFTPSKPMRVPAPAGAAAAAGDDHAAKYDSPIQPAAPPLDRDHIPPTQAHRPPRLPLPIEEEVYTPGSPIISPADITSALNQDPLEAGLPRRSSLLSSTTADDEEAGDELQPYDVDTTVKRTVPTLVEWKGKGDKVYVTGTFAGWNKKYRLHKNEGKEGLSAVIQLAPGTHHLKFLVDGDMRTAEHLPTAVDFTNVLVNYIEVSADEAPAPSKPIDIKKAKPQPFPPPGWHPPLVLPPTPKDYYHSDDPLGTARPRQSPEGKQPAQRASDDDYARRRDKVEEREGQLAEEVVKHWTTKIPRYLRDLDAAEGSQSQRRITQAMGQMPPPPALPGFLGRSILNGTTPMKDDSSVLNMPNHTVLNHLATSSIKDNVLATSVTTRYQNKYLTTIMYKPTDVKDV